MLERQESGKPWRSCQAESPGGMHLCTQRVYREEVTHAGDHVAEGRAEGELDSVVAHWPNHSDAPHEYTPSTIIQCVLCPPPCRVCGLHGHKPSHQAGGDPTMSNYQPPNPPFEHNTQPYNPVAYQPPKKKRHTGRNVMIVVGSLFALLIVAAVLSGGQQPSGAPASGAPAAVQTVDNGPTPDPIVTPTNKPPTVTKTTAPPTQPAKPKVTKPAMTASQEQAIGTAEDYLNGQSFSRKGLIEQLVFEGFSTKDATFGVDHVTVNWNEQAALTAKQYLNGQHFSRSGLIEQLEYEGFTAKQAAYGVKKAGL